MLGSLNTKDTTGTKDYGLLTKEGLSTGTARCGTCRKSCIDAAYAVHTELGAGLLESVYRIAIKHVLESSGMLAETEVKLPILFRGLNLESGLRLDILVNQCVIAELKAVEKMNPVYEAQLLTYLRLSKVRLGYLINFNVPHLKDGIKRMIV